MKQRIISMMILLLSSAPVFAVDYYDIDPTHTFPSFAVPHIQGISVWRGKFNNSSGYVILDRQQCTGSVSITIWTDSINFGLKALEDHAKTADMFDVANYPTATYTANHIIFRNGLPHRIEGVLTLKGISKVVPLEITRFKCIDHPMLHKEVCGADLTGRFDRTDFNLSYGVDPIGGSMVDLQIQVEALKNTEKTAELNKYRINK